MKSPRGMARKCSLNALKQTQCQLGVQSGKFGWPKMRTKKSTKLKETQCHPDVQGKKFGCPKMRRSQTSMKL